MISSAAARLLAFDHSPQESESRSRSWPGNHQRTVVLPRPRRLRQRLQPLSPVQQRRGQATGAEDLGPASLSFEEYQAKRQAILEETANRRLSQSNAALRSTAI
ncbi:hypothetical protein ACPA9J_33905 [Pseudomonas aeruginosa]